MIDQYLLNEFEKGRIAGPYTISPLPSLHVSRFGVIPKKYKPGKWHLILDLSSPLGHRVNEDISGIMSYSQGALMAKFDVGSAYRNVPVHSDDHYLLAIKW